MKKHLLFLIILFLFNQVFSQETIDEKIKYIEKVYRNLEYNTIAFNDLKETWNLTDPMFVREIFNRFVVSNALRINGEKPTVDTLKKLAEDVFNGYVFVELKKRYYDDEIELLRFFTESTINEDTVRTYFFDEFNDPVYIKSVLGEKVYGELKAKLYSLTDLSKTFYDSKEGYKFDIFCHVQNPELKFYQLTTNNRNKFLLSAIGRWGNDYIVLPGWYDPHYVIGMKIRYIDYLVNNQPNSAYNLEIGFSVDSKWPGFNFVEGSYGRRIYSSSSNLYIHADGNPLKLIWPKLEKFDLYFDGSFAMSEYSVKDYDINYISQFFSNRNYLVFLVKYKNLTNLMDLGMLNVGLGLASFDIYQYYLDPHKVNLINANRSSKGYFKNSIIAEAGIENFTGLLQHKFYLQLGYDITESNGYFGLKTQIMLSNSLGFDFKFFKSFAKPQNGIPFFRLDNYIVFSPIIRINY